MDQNDHLINLISDSLDEACMLYYHEYLEEHGDFIEAADYHKKAPITNYYECLIKVVDFFLNEDVGLDLKEEETIEQINEKLQNLEDELAKHNISKETMRFALLFLDITGFKSLNFSLDLITPNGVALLVARMVKVITKHQKKVHLLDPNFGCGNLAFAVSNNLDQDFTLTGFDSHELMAKVACMKANMLETPLEMHFDDCLSFVPSLADVVVSDIASYEYDNNLYHSFLYDEGVRYFPYLLIEHYLNVVDQTKYIFVIDSDFFSHPGSEKFKKVIDQKANITALITLPPTFFIDQKNAKAILVMDNNKTNTESKLNIINLPSSNNKSEFVKAVNDIEQYLDSIYNN